MANADLPVSVFSDNARQDVYECPDGPAPVTTPMCGVVRDQRKAAESDGSYTRGGERLGGEQGEVIAAPCPCATASKTVGASLAQIGTARAGAHRPARRGWS